MSTNNRLMTFELLDRMTRIVSEARAIPLSKKIMLDKDEFASLMRRLEESIPSDLQKARAIIDEEEKILAESDRIATETTQKAKQDSQAMMDSARTESQQMVTDAQNRASETMRSATDQANAMVADAQNRANALLADAQAQAQQMVADSEIVARAQAEAQEMLESAHRDCDAYSARMHDTVAQMMEQADLGLAQQLDALRALRQDFAGGAQ